MIKEVQQITDCEQTHNPHIFITTNKQLYKILGTHYDKGHAEEVLVDIRQPTQFVLTAEQNELRQQVPPQVWSQHKTDVGLIK